MLSSLQVPHFSPWKGNLQISARTGEENQAYFTSYKQKKTSLVRIMDPWICTSILPYICAFIHTYIHTYVVHVYYWIYIAKYCRFCIFRPLTTLVWTPSTNWPQSTPSEVIYLSYIHSLNINTYIHTWIGTHIPNYYYNCYYHRHNYYTSIRFYLS